MFKEPVERPQQRGGAILSAEDSKTIFGNIPEILAVHQNIVVSIVSGMYGICCMYIYALTVLCVSVYICYYPCTFH